jgi:hypothetical protein
MSDLIQKSISSASSSVSGALQNPKLDPRVMMSGMLRGALSVFKDIISGAFGIDLADRIQNDSTFVDQMTKNLKESTANLLEALGSVSDSSPESVILKSMVGINNVFVNNAEQMKEDVVDGVFSEKFKDNLNSEMTSAIEGVINETGDSVFSFGDLAFNDEFMEVMKSKISRLYGTHENGRPINAFSGEMSSKFLSSLQDVGRLYHQTNDATMIGEKDPVDVAATIRQLKEQGIPEHIVSMVQTAAENDAWDKVVDARIDRKIMDQPEVLKYIDTHAGVTEFTLGTEDDEHGRWFNNFRSELHKKDLTLLKHELTDGEIYENKGQLTHLKTQREHDFKGRSLTLSYAEEAAEKEAEKAKNDSGPSQEPGF